MFDTNSHPPALPDGRPTLKPLTVHHRWRGARTAPEHLGGTVEKLRPPSRDLVRMNVELLRQLRQRLLATDRRQGHLLLELPTVVPSGTSRHLFLLSRCILSAFSQAIHLTPFPASLFRLFYPAAPFFHPTSPAFCSTRLPSSHPPLLLLLPFPSPFFLL